MKKTTLFSSSMAFILAAYMGAFAQTKNPEATAFSWHSPTEVDANRPNCLSEAQMEAQSCQLLKS